MSDDDAHCVDPKIAAAGECDWFPPAERDALASFGNALRPSLSDTSLNA